MWICNEMMILSKKFNSTTPPATPRHCLWRSIFITFHTALVYTGEEVGWGHPGAIRPGKVLAPKHKATTSAHRSHPSARVRWQGGPDLTKRLAWAGHNPRRVAWKSPGFAPPWGGHPQNWAWHHTRASWQKRHQALQQATGTLYENPGHSCVNNHLYGTPAKGSEI